MSHARKYHPETLNEDSSPEDIARERGLLASGNALATRQQQRWYPFWQRLLSPISILCAAIAGAHHSHRACLNPSGSDLIRRAKRQPSTAAATPLQEPK